ncbi:hypothetical protein [Undibacterium sp.]|jgi:hypothetical protein|uniref:hypothetical protein n=1 Tax=Undibacterium sp. TaxID=1914977 RepID=UPI002C00E9DA|nr:hypothetical protein [Undibacterium sp.]HTD02748.1 hypothetical protein [Undibacterium sp.]
MAKKLKLDKQVVRTLTPDEIDAVAGGGISDFGDDDTLAGGTGGWMCWSFQISLAICPTNGCSKACGTTTGDAGCTTGTAETYNCGIA